ncbi:autotransporter outer membrane beta-barrel domain-containing protein, partial [Salmonella enterica subsp. enterica serovar Kentucky]|nr:autotransporter outer membrane beta-barrel domain-containing protein [Salmonella enterica subsp. enterica serovar Kentucky]
AGAQTIEGIEIVNVAGNSNGTFEKASRIVAGAYDYNVVQKGKTALEQLGRITQVAFDKTGTLTIGKPRVTAIHPASGISEAELLA